MILSWLSKVMCVKRSRQKMVTPSEDEEGVLMEGDCPSLGGEEDSLGGEEDRTGEPGETKEETGFCDLEGTEESIRALIR